MSLSIRFLNYKSVNFISYLLLWPIERRIHTFDNRISVIFSLIAEQGRCARDFPSILHSQPVALGHHAKSPPSENFAPHCDFKFVTLHCRIISRPGRTFRPLSRSHAWH
jgi:hypothetical protein